MSLDRAIRALEISKPIAKSIPIAGTYLEGVIELLLIGCNDAKQVKSNKAESAALAERAVLCLVIVIEKTQELPESQVSTRMASIHELEDLTKELVEKNKKRAQRSSTSRLFSKTKDKEEIDSLTKRFDRVIERFGLEAQLFTVYDVEDILTRVKQMQASQQQMIKTQQQVLGAHIRTEQKDLLDRLKPFTNARHDHEDAPRGCTENTRVGVRSFVRQWVTDDLASESILWLSGLAGTGKTAIMKTLSQEFAQLGLLGGSYFINHRSPEGRNPQNVIRTLIHQLAHFQPTLREPICSVIRDCPEIVDQEIALQIPVLLSDVFTTLVSKIEHPIVLMIDALDECEKKDEIEGGQLLPALIRMILQHSAKLKLIVTSRITPTIQAIFDAVATKQFRLHEVEHETVAGDIRLFLKAELERITLKKGLQHAPLWYTPEDITELVARAGNLFIYAATAVKWIDNMRHLPNERLLQVLQWRPHSGSTSPYQSIDELYAGILRNALGLDPRDHDVIGKRVRRVLETIVVAFRPLDISELAAIVEVEEDVLRLDLEQLSSVLNVPAKNTSGQVAVYHASFVEYLVDEHRCPSNSMFHIPLWEAHGRVGSRCLDLSYNRRYGKQGSAATGDNNSQVIHQYVSEEWKRHLQLSSISSSYLVTAIGKIRRILSQYNEDIDIMVDLSYLLGCQSRRTDDVKILHEQIAIDRRLMKTSTSSGPYGDIRLNNLASGLKSLYDRNGDMELLNEAIELDRRALELRPPGHPARDFSLNNLASGLKSLYDRSGDMELLNEAIKLHREALDLRPPGHPNRDYSLNNLASGLKSLYERNEDMGLLNEAIELHREALDLHPPGHPTRDFPLIHLAHGLKSLYERNGDIGLLNETIKLDRDALELCPPGHPNRDYSLNNLAFGLKSLYDRNGDTELLNEAIKLHREALDLRPPGHPARDTSLINLASGLKSLYERNRDMELLNEVFRLHQETLDLCPPGHPSRHSSIYHYVNTIHSIYNNTRNVSLTNEAVQLSREALSLCSPTRYDYSSFLRLLSHSLRLYGEALGDQAAIIEADEVSARAEALEAVTPN